MPRFVFETDVVSGAQLDAAMRLSQRRFPEIAIETLCGAREDGNDRVRWICRAPSLSHVDRWTALSGLPVESLRPKDEG